MSNLKVTQNLQLELTTAHAFLKALDQSTNEFTFQTFDDRQARDKSLNKILHGTLEQHLKTLIELNNAGAGVFVCVNATNFNGRKLENFVKVRAFFTDHDTELPTSYHLQPTMVVQTSGNKGHAYWVLKGGAELDHFKTDQQVLIRHYGSDNAVCDASRVMRLPGFYHMKDASKPQLVQLLSCDAQLKYSPSEVLGGLQPATKAKVQTTSTQHQGSLKALVKALEEAEEGTRNDTLNKCAFAAGKLVAKGECQETEALNELAKAGLSIGLDLPEVNGTVLRAIRDGIKAGEKEAKQGSKSSSAKLLQALKSEYANRLQWDTLKDKPMLDGDTIEWASLEMMLSEELDLNIDSSKLSNFVSALAHLNPFNPVKHYLEGLWQQHTPTEQPASSIIEVLGRDILGLRTQLELTYLKKFMVGAVARAYAPGCKLDTLFVLTGGQGLGKTTFFQNLFGFNWFVTMGEVANEREELMTFHQHWCCEYGEFETAAGKKAVSAMKNFLSRQKDSFREPYAREATDHLRAFILCGTSNETEFLTDPTGNRRFWVAALTKKVDQRWVVGNRDALWLEAVQLYKAQCIWWLTDEEQAIQEEVTKAHSIKSETYDLIIAWLQGGHPCNGTSCDKYTGVGFTTTHILDKVLPQNQNRKQAEMEASKVLKSLGLTKKRTRLNGALVYLWQGTPTCIAGLVNSTYNALKDEDVCEDF